VCKTNRVQIKQTVCKANRVQNKPCAKQTVCKVPTKRVQSTNKPCAKLRSGALTHSQSDVLSGKQNVITKGKLCMAAVKVSGASSVALVHGEVHLLHMQVLL